VNVRELIARSASWLAGKGTGSARLEAELLLAHVLDVERLRLYLDADRPLLDAEVIVYAGDETVFSGRTYATGQVLFFPKALGVSDQVTSFQVVAEKDGARGEAKLVRGETHQLTLNLAQSDFGPEEPLNLDVLFLIDSTGSMADEIDKLQASIREIAARIDRLPGQPRVRFAMTIYRDRGDLFVSRTFDFTPDVLEFSKALALVEAEGGGDYPESLNEALHRAIPRVLKRGLKNLGTSLGTGETNFYSVARHRGRNKDELKVFRRTDLPCPRCKSLIERIIVGQRSTHICPKCQEL